MVTGAAIFQKVTYAAIATATSAHHLTVLGGFHPASKHGLPATVKTLLLLGPSEPGFWDYFCAQPEYGDAQPDPMDRWSTRVISALASQFNATAHFPFGSPPFRPFIQWALATKRAHSSPISLLVHDTSGLFVSYRGALAFDQHINLPVQPANPCETCGTEPCKTACPVSALGRTYDIAACKADLDRPANTCMVRGCAARRACPINQNYGRVEKHSAFHMDYFK